MNDGDPLLGRPGGEHRVLEPPGAPPLLADRLDALADLWDDEVRLELEAVVLTPEGHRGLVERLGHDPAALLGAFAETVAERGGLAAEASDATLVGTVAAVGRRRRTPPPTGTRVAVAAPGGAIPLFALPTPDADGSRVVRVRGHAVVAADLGLVHLAGEPPAMAAELTRVADLPGTLRAGQHVLVLGATTAVGAVATVAAVAQGRQVTAVVGTLGDARIARALGATEVVLADLADPVGTEALLPGAGAGGLVVLADPAGAALAARSGPDVQVLTDLVSAPATAAAVAHHARAGGRTVSVHLGRAPVTDEGVAVLDLVASREVLAQVLRWRAGLAPAPSVPDPEEP